MDRKIDYLFFSNHQSTSEVLEVDIAPCMGASRNLGPSNNNPLVLTKIKRRINKVKKQ